MVNRLWYANEIEIIVPAWRCQTGILFFMLSSLTLHLSVHYAFSLGSVLLSNSVLRFIFRQNHKNLHMYMFGNTSLNWMIHFELFYCGKICSDLLSYLKYERNAFCENADACIFVVLSKSSILEQFESNWFIKNWWPGDQKMVTNISDQEISLSTSVTNC